MKYVLFFHIIYAKLYRSKDVYDFKWTCLQKITRVVHWNVRRPEAYTTMTTSQMCYRWRNIYIHIYVYKHTILTRGFNPPICTKYLPRILSPSRRGKNKTSLGGGGDLDLYVNASPIQNVMRIVLSNDENVHGTRIFLCTNTYTYTTTEDRTVHYNITFNMSACGGHGRLSRWGRRRRKKNKREKSATLPIHDVPISRSGTGVHKSTCVCICIFYAQTHLHVTI